VCAILMHMRGRPEEWRTLPPPGDIVLLVKRELKDWQSGRCWRECGGNALCWIPVFGFGKSFDENYPLLARFSELQAAGFPLLVGTSRKSFIGRTLSKDGKDAPPQDRLYGTLATQTALILKGAHIIRTHDVKAAADGGARGGRNFASALKVPQRNPCCLCKSLFCIVLDESRFVLTYHDREINQFRRRKRSPRSEPEKAPI